MTRWLRWIPVALGAVWAANALVGRNRRKRRWMDAARSWMPIVQRWSMRGLRQLVRR